VEGELELVTDGAAEPVSTADLKAHMKVDGSTEDAYIAGLEKAARRLVERLTGKRLIKQTWAYWLHAFPACGEIVLPIGPVSAVTGVSTFDAANTEASFSATNYFVDVKSQRARVLLKAGASWPCPADGLRVANGVKVAFEVGYGTAGTSVPAELIHAVKLLVAEWYAKREASAEASFNQIPFGIRALIAPYRTWGTVL